MVAVTETLPGILPSINEKTDITEVPVGQEDNWFDAADHDILGGHVMATARALRMQALCAAISPATAGVNAKVVRFTGVDVTSGLARASAALTTDLNKEWAAAMEAIEQGGDLDGTASATGFFGIHRGVISGTFVTSTLYGLSNGGGLVTYTGGIHPPKAIGLTTSYAYFDVGGRAMADDSTIEFTASGTLGIKSGATLSLADTYINGTLGVSGLTTLSGGLASTYVNGTLGVSGTTTLSGALMLNGALSMVNTGGLNPTFYTSSSYIYMDMRGGDSAIRYRDIATGALLFSVGKDNTDNTYRMSAGGLLGTTDRFIFNFATGNLNLVTPGSLSVGGTEVISSARHLQGSQLTITGSLGNFAVNSNGNVVTFTRAGANFIYASNASGSLQIGQVNNTDAIIIDSTGSITMLSLVNDLAIYLASGKHLSVFTGGIKVGGTEIVSAARIANFASIKVGGTEIVSSARIANLVSLKIGGNEVISSTRIGKLSQLNIGIIPVIDSGLNATFTNITCLVNIKHSVEAGITASTTQSQGQQPLTKDINEIATCANANDVVTMPTAAAGMTIYVRNNGANALQIFPASGDDIDGTGVDASVTLAAGASVVYRAIDATNWYS